MAKVCKPYSFSTKLCSFFHVTKNSLNPPGNSNNSSYGNTWRNLEWLTTVDNSVEESSVSISRRNEQKTVLNERRIDAALLKESYISLTKLYIRHYKCVRSDEISHFLTRNVIAEVIWKKIYTNSSLSINN